MSIVKAPFFSFDARCQTANSICNQKWKGQHIVRKKPFPTDPKTSSQLDRRDTFREGVRRWKTASFTSRDFQAWRHHLNSMKLAVNIFSGWQFTFIYWFRLGYDPWPVWNFQDSYQNFTSRFFSFFSFPGLTFLVRTYPYRRMRILNEFVVHQGPPGHYHGSVTGLSYGDLLDFNPAQEFPDGTIEGFCGRYTLRHP